MQIKLIAIAAMAFAASMASATTPAEDNPTPLPPVVPPTIGVTNELNGGTSTVAPVFNNIVQQPTSPAPAQAGPTTTQQQQQQRQQQQTRQQTRVVVNNAAPAAGLLGVGATASGGVDNSVHYKFIPPAPAAPPSYAPGAAIVQIVSECGPQRLRASTPIEGSFHGLIGQREAVPQGYTEEGRDNYEPYRQVVLPDGTIRLFGHQQITFAALVNVSSARQLGVGGGGSERWGNGSLGTSSANNQLVKTIELVSCDAGTFVPLPVPPAEPPSRDEPPLTPRPKKRDRN